MSEVIRSLLSSFLWSFNSRDAINTLLNFHRHNEHRPNCAKPLQAILGRQKRHSRSKIAHCNRFCKNSRDWARCLDVLIFIMAGNYLFRRRVGANTSSILPQPFFFSLLINLSLMNFTQSNFGQTEVLEI